MPFRFFHTYPAGFKVNYGLVLGWRLRSRDNRSPSLLRVPGSRSGQHHDRVQQEEWFVFSVVVDSIVPSGNTSVSVFAGSAHVRPRGGMFRMLLQQVILGLQLLDYAEHRFDATESDVRGIIFVGTTNS
jgi:hypothetical protein